MPTSLDEEEGAAPGRKNRRRHRRRDRGDIVKQPGGTASIDLSISVIGNTPNNCVGAIC